jgi:hypothetical protein
LKMKKRATIFATVMTCAVFFSTVSNFTVITLFRRRLLRQTFLYKTNTSTVYISDIIVVNVYHQIDSRTLHIRLGQVRQSFVNVRKPFVSFRKRSVIYSIFRVAMHSGRSATCSSQKI